MPASARPGRPGPPGAPGAGAAPPLVFEQGTPADVWLIPHDFASEPDVTFIDDYDRVGPVATDYPTPSLVRLSFDGASTGKAVIRP